MKNNIREEIKKKIASFLENPGYFSILILGNSGSGKEFFLKSFFKKKEINSNKYCIFQPYEIGNTEEEISNVFVKKFIEELTDLQQNILHKALSTSDGKIGLNKNIGLKRIIFTSTFNVEQLRDSKEHISDRFWNRISQLVVEFPSFKEYSANIVHDFKSVWEKMEFQEYPKVPIDSEFQFWLRENCGTFAGNFRDLDTIAILWHQYRLIEYKGLKQKYKSDIETRIFRKVRNDFESFNHFPTQKSDTSNSFEFEKGKTWEQIERGFKSKFKTWAKREYVTIKNATEELKMPSRKMDKW